MHKIISMQGPFEASALEIFECSDENFLVSVTTENGARASSNGIILCKLESREFAKLPNKA